MSQSLRGKVGQSLLVLAFAAVLFTLGAPSDASFAAALWVGWPLAVSAVIVHGVRLRGLKRPRGLIPWVAALYELALAIGMAAWFSFWMWGFNWT